MPLHRGVVNCRVPLIAVKPNQIANRTLNFEAGNDEDQATMKESFSLVQNILFIGYADVFPAHL